VIKLLLFKTLLENQKRDSVTAYNDRKKFPSPNILPFILVAAPWILEQSEQS
jgi:hypothetical protein